MSHLRTVASSVDGIVVRSAEFVGGDGSGLSEFDIHFDDEFCVRADSDPDQGEIDRELFDVCGNRLDVTGPDEFVHFSPLMNRDIVFTERLRNAFLDRIAEGWE